MKALRRLIRLTLLTAVTAGVAYVAQDFWIYPALSKSKRFEFSSKEQPPPRAVERIRIESGENELEAWKLAASGEAAPIALLLHSEKQTLPDAYKIQKFFHSLGYTSYTFDYRGMGASTGWPTEQGLMEDAEAAFAEVAAREKTAPADILLVGVSLGASLAARLAETHQSRSLFLLLPHPGLEARMSRMGFEQATPLLRASFPLEVPLGMLEDRCLVFVNSPVGSGPSDGEVSRLADLAATQNTVHRFTSTTTARPLELLETLRSQVEAALAQCRGRT